MIVGLHLALLVAMIPDYFADNDLGFHVSLGRQYGERGTYFWDHLNWAPTGRPNLQGPALHAAIGLLGRLLGGEGDDYVRAFAVLAVLQWLAAVGTAIYFARRLAGDWAALFAAALFTGSAYAAGSFFVGVPSGWIFILTPWAIHFFLGERYLVSAGLAAVVTYVHLGGAPAVGFGLLLAAATTRRWRGLLFVGAVAVALASPYLIHLARHLEWYTGRRGHVAGSIAWLIYVPAAAGLLWMLRRERLGTVHSVTYFRDRGEALVETRDSGLLGVLNRLHHTAGFWHESPALKAWGVLVAITSAALILLAATGIYLWARLRNERRVGAFLLAAGLMYSLTLVWLIRTA